MKIKTAEKILKKWYNPLHGIGEIAELQIIEAMKEYAQYVAQQALENADRRVGAFPNYRNLVTDKITNPDNIPTI